MAMGLHPGEADGTFIHDLPLRLGVADDRFLGAMAGCFLVALPGGADLGLIRRWGPNFGFAAAADFLLAGIVFAALVDWPVFSGAAAACTSPG